MKKREISNDHQMEFDFTERSTNEEIIANFKKFFEKLGPEALDQIENQALAEEPEKGINVALQDAYNAYMEKNRQEPTDDDKPTSSKN